MALCPWPLELLQVQRQSSVPILLTPASKYPLPLALLTPAWGALLGWGEWSGWDGLLQCSALPGWA